MNCNRKLAQVKNISISSGHCGALQEGGGGKNPSVACLLAVLKVVFDT